MKGKEILKFFAFIVLPAGFIAGSIYYTPKIKKWYKNKKEKKDNNGI